MEGIKLAIVTVVLGIFLIAASSVFILDINDSNLVIKQATDDQNIIHLSGFVQDSSSSIYHIATFKWESSIWIFVICGLDVGEMSGNLNYSFQVPSSINTVNFGKEGVVIWSREEGVFPKNRVRYRLKIGSGFHNLTK